MDARTIRPRGFPFAPSDQRGFTLIEMMAVVLIMGTVLLLVPANLQGVGSQGKLTNTANSLVAAFNGARERAVLDGYEVHLELGAFRDGDDWRNGWRFKFTNVPPPEVAGGEQADAAEQERLRAQRTREREWLTTSWHPCQSGVEITGVSSRKGSWDKINEGGDPRDVRFFADGTVESGFAVRLINEDMDTDREYKTVTVIVNALTSEASWVEGEQDLPEALPSSNFGN